MKLMRKLGIVTILITIALVVALSAKGVHEQVLKTAQIDEASGLARSLINPEILYTHNDSGGENAIYAIDTKGQLRARIVIEGVQNRDWEEIATARDPISGKAHIYIGEIGDNAARYSSVSVYRFPEPSLVSGDSLYTIKTYDTITIQYEDGPRDAEAMFVQPQTGDLYIISKREDKVGIYRIPYPQQTLKINTATKVGTMNMQWVTAADISPNGRSILVKNYASVKRFKVGRKQSITEALSRRPKNMPYKIEPQGEAICFDHKGKGYYTLSEAGDDGIQILYYYK